MSDKMSDVETPSTKTEPKRSQSPESTMLHIGNLTRNVREAHLEEICGTYGKIRKVDLMIDKKVNLSKGFAYVEFESRKDAEQAQLYLDGAQVDSNKIKVAFILVQKRQRRSESPKRMEKEQRSRDAPPSARDSRNPSRRSTSNENKRARDVDHHKRDSDRPRSSERARSSDRRLPDSRPAHDSRYSRNAPRYGGRERSPARRPPPRKWPSPQRRRLSPSPRRRRSPVGRNNNPVTSQRNRYRSPVGRSSTTRKRSRSRSRGRQEGRGRKRQDSSSRSSSRSASYSRSNSRSGSSGSSRSSASSSRSR